MGSKKKTYYYIMLASEFFADEIVSRLRAMDNGDALALVYLHMLAYYVKTEGVIVIEVDTGESIAEQMHWQVHEDVALIAKVIETLEKHKRLVVEEENVYVLKGIDKLIGQDTNFAVQKRSERERKKVMTIMATISMIVSTVVTTKIIMMSVLVSTMATMAIIVGLWRTLSKILKPNQRRAIKKRWLVLDWQRLG